MLSASYTLMFFIQILLLLSCPSHNFLPLSGGLGVQRYMVCSGAKYGGQMNNTIEMFNGVRHFVRQMAAHFAYSLL